MCQYLVENGYRTVVSDDAARLAREGVSPGDRTVMLAFDDAWSSLWLVVGPLLRKYDLRAVAYVIPARTIETDTVRPTIDDGPVDVERADRSSQPFCTWPELRALATSGHVDVQSHTWSHSMIFTGEKVIDAVGPAFAREPRLNRPRIDTGGHLEFLEPDRLGFPLFARRSRMSDGRRFLPDQDACARAEALATEVKAGGGAVSRIAGTWETDDQRDAETDHELDRARQEIALRVGMPVRHVCLPWGVSGARTRPALERLGFVSAFANRWAGRFAVSAGDDPYYLKRLNGRLIFSLPGRGRKTFALFG